MANRYTLNLLWGSNSPSRIIDPDLDTTHPIFEPNKYNKGWGGYQSVPTENKQPSAWRNFMLNNNDVRILALATSGMATWHPATNYKKGALSAGSDGRIYFAKSANSGVDPVGDVTVWTDSLANLSAAEVQVFFDEIAAAQALHYEDYSNTHQVRANQFYAGVGYFDYEITTLVNNAGQDTTTHIGRTDDPHDVSAVQLNCLDAITGGEFTGEVLLNLGIKLNTKWVDVYEGAIAVALAGFIEIGIDFEGFPIIGTEQLTNKRSEVLHTTNLDRIQDALEAKYTLPVPIVSVPLASSLNDIGLGYSQIVFDRPSTLAYTDKSGVAKTAAIDEDVYDKDGLIFTADTDLYLSPSEVVIAGGYTCAFVGDGVLQVLDGTTWSGSLKNLVGTYSRVRDFRIYTPLSDQQKSKLRRHYG